jgi:putative phosphoesterase
LDSSGKTIFCVTKTDIVTIGLLSDTHGYLDPKVFEHFKACDELWHAGDFGTTAVADTLETFKPLRGVFGNIDDKDLQARFPEDLFFECEGVQIMMTHIGGAPPNYNPRARKLLNNKKPDVLICGHSHILRVKKDPKFDILYINPGAAGNQGFHLMRTMMRMQIADGKIGKMEVIELGKRGEII